MQFKKEDIWVHLTNIQSMKQRMSGIASGRFVGVKRNLWLLVANGYASLVVIMLIELMTQR